MANYKMILSYDGTKYKGWQSQGNTRDTIQGKLQDILSELAGEAIAVIGSGRTDAGVHAKGQTANFHMHMTDEIRDRIRGTGIRTARTVGGRTASRSETDIGSADAHDDRKQGREGVTDNGKIKCGSISDSEYALLVYINQKLPEDIAVISIKTVDERFHARYSEKGKTYRYRIHVSPIADPFERRFVYTYLDYELDVNAMRRAAELLTGTHDFRAFCGNKQMKKSTVRTISEIKIEEIRDEFGICEIAIDFAGDGFLQNMIRILTGTLIEVGSGRRSPESMTEILTSLDRQRAGYTAPAQGLCLMEVYY